MFDLLIKNAIIVDGTGLMPYIGHIAIKDGIIAKICRLNENDYYNCKGEKCEKRVKAAKAEVLIEGAEIQASKVLDACGKYVTPGFIDIHRHSDLKALEPDFGIIELRQGITATVSGNCGMSAAPCTPEMSTILYDFLEPCLGRGSQDIAFESYGEYISQLKKMSMRINHTFLIGNGTVRIAVKGFNPSPMAEKEMDKAKWYIEEALSAGAKGLSMGLMYAPENYYSFDELVELAKVLRRYGGVLATHIRGEGNNLISSINEVIKIAEKAQVPLHISHLKAAGRNNWGEKLQIAMETILKWRAKGMDITCDVYPYEAGSTSLFTLLPPSILEDGMEEMVKKLKDKDVRNWVKKELSLEHSDWDNLMYSLGWDSVVISSVNNEKNKLFIGKSIEEIAQNYGKDAVDCLLDLIVSENGKTGMVMFHMSPNDVRQVLKWENSIIVSDSLYPGKGLPHPRLYGSFTRVLAKYVRDEKLLTIEEAVRKMTSFPAWRMSIEDKGLIKEGYHADMVLFDIENIEDTATYIDPINYSKGFDYVFMSGKEVIVNDKINDVFYGKYMQRS